MRGAALPASRQTGSSARRSEEAVLSTQFTIIRRCFQNRRVIEPATVVHWRWHRPSSRPLFRREFHKHSDRLYGLRMFRLCLVKRDDVWR